MGSVFKNDPTRKLKGRPNQKEVKTTNMEPNGCESEPTDVPIQPLGNRVEQIKKRGAHQKKIWSKL